MNNAVPRMPRKTIIPHQPLAIGPLIANYIYDMTQSYTPVIWAAIPGYLIAALLFAALRPAQELTRRAGTA